MAKCKSLVAALTAGLSLAVASSSAFAVIETGDKRGRNLADIAAWPTMLVLKVGEASACSSLVIGEQVVLTAASCLQSDKRGAVVVGGQAVDLECNVHRDFAREPQADFALCAASAPLPLQRFERVGVESLTSGSSRAVVMLGFGCMQPLGLDGAFGQLTIGEASMRPVDADDLQALVEGSVLCAGDGGGGTFVNAGDGPEGRLLVGVNSIGDAQSMSSIALTSTLLFREWAEAWAREKGVTICGLDGSAKACVPADGARRVGSRRAQRSPASASSGVIATEPSGKPPASPVLLRVSHRKGEKVEEVVERSCGPQPAAYYSYMSGLVASGEIALEGRQAGGYLTDFVFEQGGVIGIPRCVAKQFSPVVEEVVGNKDETIRKIFDRTSDVAFPWSTSAVTQTKPPTTLWPGIATSSGAGTQDFSGLVFDNEFNTGHRTLYAQTGAPSSAGINGLAVPPGFSLDSNQGESSGSSRRAALPRLASLAITDPLSVPATATEPYEGRPGFRPLLTLSDAEAGLHCRSDASRDELAARYPYDLEAVKRFMEINKSFRNKFNIESTPVSIFIADNGLFYPAIESIVPPKRRQSVIGIPSDVANFVDGKPSHGTQVTSLAFGGQLFIDAFMDHADRPIFMLKFGRVYQPTMNNGWQDDQDSINGLVTTASTDKGIVNISFASLNSIRAPSKSTIEKSSDGALIVVAAGNAPSGADKSDEIFLSPSPGHSQYPALFGGGYGGNVITVAAARANGELAGFSYWNRDYVDIAAPGCSIAALTVQSFDTVDPKFDYTNVSGTSVAAPLVTFAAALVRSELGTKSSDMSAAVLKRRLMVASDIKNHLARKRQVADGRHLNIPKAIASLYYDVLELKETRKLLQGEIVFMSKARAEAYANDLAAKPEPLRQFDICGGPLGVKTDWILKVAPGYKGQDDDSDSTESGTLIYYKLEDRPNYPESGHIHRRVCADALSTVRIGFRDFNTPKARFKLYDIDQIRDIVMREVQE